MRIVVFSDSHGKFSVLEEVVERHREQADIFIHLGDGEDEAELLRNLHPELQIEFVSGNCDFGSLIPDYNIIEAAGKKIFFTHGHRFGVKDSLARLEEYARNLGADIALYGHTHEEYVEYCDGLYIMNPGSIGRPQGLPSYGIIDITSAGIHMHTASLEY